MPNLEINAGLTSIAKGPVQVPISWSARWGGRLVNLCQYKVIAGYALLTSTTTSYAIGGGLILLLDIPLNYCLASVFGDERSDNSKPHKFCRLVIGLAIMGTTIYKVNTWTLRKLALPLGRTSSIVITITVAAIPVLYLIKALIGEPSRAAVERAVLEVRRAGQVAPAVLDRRAGRTALNNWMPDI